MFPFSSGKGGGGEVKIREGHNKALKKNLKVRPGRVEKSKAVSSPMLDLPIFLYHFKDNRINLQKWPDLLSRE